MKPKTAAKRRGRAPAAKPPADKGPTDPALPPETELLHRIVVENTPDGLFVIRDGRMVFANRAFSEMVGFSNPGDIVGRDFRDLVAPEDLPMVAERYRRRQRGEDVPEDYEFSLFTKDGRRRVHLTATAVQRPDGTFSVGAVREFTRQCGVHNTLKASENRFRTLTESSGDIVVIIGADGGYSYVSPSVTRMLGYEVAELVGRAPSAIVFPEDLPLLTGAVREAEAKPGESVPVNRFRVLSKNGIYAYLEGQVTCLYGVSGVDGVVLTCRDVTEKKRMEDERLLREKLQSIMEMAGAVCHELNQPLQAIYALAELLLAENEDRPDVAERARMLLLQTERIGGITKKLMGITRYRKRLYADGAMILDIDRSAPGEGGPKGESRKPRKKKTATREKNPPSL